MTFQTIFYEVLCSMFRKSKLQRGQPFLEFTTDTGNIQGGDTMSKKQINLGPQSGPGSLTFEEACEKARTLKEQPMFIVKTSKYGRHPGSWYGKGFSSKGLTYDDVLHRLCENQSLGLFSRRKTWLLHPEESW